MSSLRDAIYGLAIGDAVGVPYEFRKRGTFKCTDMVGNGTHNQPIGTWSDDTSMTLATCMSIKNKGRVDTDDIRKEFECWLLDKKYTPFGEVFDCGNTCVKAIYDKKGCDGAWSNGNGSLMRIIPLAFLDGIIDREIAVTSAVTHAHHISKEGCIYYVRIAIDLLNGVELKKSIERHIPEGSVYYKLLRIEACKEQEIKSTGYIVDTLEAAIWCLMNTDSYRDCILKAVNLGDDTDTVAAVAGGLAGIIYGCDNIPEDWLDKLKGKNIIEACLF
jgi:ADP-ribosylglycohydrolase